MSLIALGQMHLLAGWLAGWLAERRVLMGLNAAVKRQDPKIHNRAEISRPPKYAFKKTS